MYSYSIPNVAFNGKYNITITSLPAVKEDMDKSCSFITVKSEGKVLIQQQTFLHCFAKQIVILNDYVARYYGTCYLPVQKTVIMKSLLKNINIILMFIVFILNHL